MSLNNPRCLQNNNDEMKAGGLAIAKAKVKVETRGYLTGLSIQTARSPNSAELDKEFFLLFENPKK
jgi:hypothetical protein